MTRASAWQGMAVFAPKSARAGASGRYERLGKIRAVVFSPDGRRAVGVLVRRPDLAGMVKRPDSFVAIDAVAPCDGGARVRGDAAMDEAARRRLGIEEAWDSCVIWCGMDAVTEGGRELGFVGDVTFDATSGAVRLFHIGDGGLANRLVGAVEIPVGLLRACRGGRMVLADEAASLVPSGGLAARAGAAVGRAQVEGGKAAARAGEAADQALAQGSRALGRQIGKTKGMFGSFMDEYRKASS